MEDHESSGQGGPENWLGRAKVDGQAEENFLAFWSDW